MANIYETLITGGAPEVGSSDASSLAAGLRGDRGLAMLAQISGDSVLAPLGAQMAKRVRSDADSMRKSSLERARRKQEEERLAAQQGYQRQVLAGQAAGRAQQASQHAASLANARDIAAVKASAKKKIPNRAKRDLAEMAPVVQIGEDLVSTFDPEERSQFADITSGAVGALSPALGQMTSTWLNSEKGAAWREKLKNWVADIRHSRLGAALTKTELETSAAWDPSDSGIGPEQIVQRIKNLVDAKRMEAQEIYALEDIDQSEWQPWVQGTTAPAAPAAPAQSGQRMVMEADL